MTHTFRTRLCFAGLAIAVIGALDAGLLGFELLGFKWNTSQVLYYVNPRNIHMSDADALSAIQRAADAWATQASANIQLVYGGTTNSGSLSLNQRNEVFFRSDSSAGGVTYWWTDGYGNLIDADIAFNQGAFAFASDDMLCSGAIYVQDLATHEFGHVLGLNHSSVGDSTMYPYMPGYCDTSWRTLAADDIAAIETAYPGTGSSQLRLPSSPSGLNVAPNPLNPTASLLLTWSDNSSNENGFRIERSSDGWNFTTIREIGANVVQYTDGSLVAGGSYVYRVAAFNRDGASDYSNIASGQTATSPAEAPAAPAPLPADGPTLSVRAYKKKGLQQADLKWSGFGSGGVDVYRNGAMRTSTPNDGSYTDPINLKGAGSYTYQLCESGGSTCSNQVKISF